MGTHAARCRRAFSLLEILIALAIVGVLVGLAVPGFAVLRSRANDSAIGWEISDLSRALEIYKRDKGDYPPSMGEDYSAANRNRTICEQHLRTCYPRATKRAKDYFYDYIAPELDQDEAIVFWLSMTTVDEQDPFPLAVINCSPIPKPWFRAAPPRLYYSFREDRLWDTPDDPDSFPAYRPLHCQGTTFVHIDARYYRFHLTPATAAISAVQPYFDSDGKPIHPSSFQIITAGQDGDYGSLYDAVANPSLLKSFPSGNNLRAADFDNLTNFSEGKRLSAWMP